MNRTTAFLAALLAARFLSADTGVLIPAGRTDPDPSKLSLEEMHVSAAIDEGFARTSVMQIFRNRTGADLEGVYRFVIPESAAVSRFAIWEDGVRIPGVVLEKRRAAEIYDAIVSRRRDPGLMRQEDEEKRNVFSVKVFPIPALGTKRIELEYTERLEVDSLAVRYRLPLKPSAWRAQTAGLFSLSVRVSGGAPIAEWTARGRSVPVAVKRIGPGSLAGDFVGSAVALTDDFSLEYRLGIRADHHLSLLAYRNPDRTHRIVPVFAGGRPVPETDGYFLSRVYANLASGPRPDGAASRKAVTVLFDLSLSMRWEKLDRAWDVLDGLLRSLGPSDAFRVVLFNDRVRAFPQDGGFAPPPETARALDWVREQYQAGGTDLKQSLAAAVAGCARAGGRQAAVVVISDGNPTAGELAVGAIADPIAEAALKAAVPIHCAGIGEDANATLLESLARRTDGSYCWITETEDASYKTGILVNRLSERILTGGRVALEGAVSRVYPAEPVRFFDRSSMEFVGRYARPGPSRATVTAEYGGRRLTWTHPVNLPEKDLSHPEVPRLWARARVDELVRLIRTKEEREEWIREIVSLSKEYNFITPYTSFLAAPRSLLRPRAIKPGDPVLRVRAGPEIVAAAAVFPFGTIKPLRRNNRRGVWETRFLAPADMRDGAWRCLIVLTDRNGRQYREEKTFVIDSRPPRLDVRLASRRVRPGGDLEVVVRADADARSISARLPGGAPAAVVWRADRKASVGRVAVPAGLPAGRYGLLVTAEDAARNATSVTVPIEIMGL